MALRVLIRRGCALGAALVLASPAVGQKPPPDLNAIMKEMGVAATRSVSSDICFPATAQEYQAVGKNAILMLTASSAIATELPLRSAYLEVKGVRVPLNRLALFPTQTVMHNGETYTEQVSFYLLPISLLKNASELAVDFTGERRSFGVMHFTKQSGVEGAPSFVRLDEYDAPADPAMAAVEGLLAREYPDYFAHSAPK